MARSLQVLVIVCVVVLLSRVHRGKSQCDSVRIGAALFEILQPLLDGIKSDIASLTEIVSQQNETLRHLNDSMASLREIELPIITEMVSQQNESLRHLNDSMASLREIELPSITEMVSQQNDSVASLMDEMDEYKSEVKSDLVALNASISNVLGDELNLINENICGKIDKFQSTLDSLDTKIDLESTSLETQVISSHAKLDSLNDLISEDIMSGLSNVTDRIRDKIEENEEKISTELLELGQGIGCYTCGGTGGWRRAAYLDMTDPNTNCPSGWNMTGYSKKTCGRATDGSSTCDSVFFPVSGGPYSQVCGRIRAYQWGLPLAFHGSGVYGGASIDDAYFSGVAVMHGTPRQHIWTFAAGGKENYTAACFYYYYMCPCDNTGYYNPPPFVGEDYFCESGNLHPGHYRLPWNRLYSNDTLWDGKDCHSTSSCCSLHYPPYFTKSLSEPTTDDIELRMCFYFPQYSENLAIELVDLYVR